MDKTPSTMLSLLFMSTFIMTSGCYECSRRSRMERNSENAKVWVYESATYIIREQMAKRASQELDAGELARAFAAWDDEYNNGLVRELLLMSPFFVVVSEHQESVEVVVPRQDRHGPLWAVGKRDPSGFSFRIVFDVPDELSASDVRVLECTEGALRSAARISCSPSGIAPTNLATFQAGAN